MGLQQAGGLAVTAPATGEGITSIAPDDTAGVSRRVEQAVQAQAHWQALPYERREEFLQRLSGAVKAQRETLARLIALEGGKTHKEACAEVDGSAEVLLKTIRDAHAAHGVPLPDLGDMARRKERERLPVGVVGLITSFNFPLAVASWNIAPALLAGNGVVWKPSEKTPLTALAYKKVFDQIAKECGASADILNIAIGTRMVGEALVAHEQVDMISATGSVGMGMGIKAVLAKKRNHQVKPILELGGNNAIVISNRCSPGHLEWALGALLNSVFGTSGQRCTNTRRLIVHADVYDSVIGKLKDQFKAFIASGAIRNPLIGESSEYGYGPLIDQDAFERFQAAIGQARSEGGTVVFGQRVLQEEHPQAYYVEPALALMPSHTPVMHQETFAPVLFVTQYSGDIGNAIAMVNAPANAGLVNGIYTQSQKEADRFSADNQAGHTVINPKTGTGTPAHGMGFGGNKESGEGEILNSADPLKAFTKAGRTKRIAQNKTIPMDA